ncbi:hypothetical protein ACFSQZ_12920 [Rubritalea spongiae]|uniref:Uncharacterized protein n=2 Tax=Rubritalea spongiae TaxID=430797 RepID=A0ABW5E4F8_9BACT
MLVLYGLHLLTRNASIEDAVSSERQAEVEHKFQREHLTHGRREGNSHFTKAKPMSSMAGTTGSGYQYELKELNYAPMIDREQRRIQMEEMRQIEDPELRMEKARALSQQRMQQRRAFEESLTAEQRLQKRLLQRLSLVDKMSQSLYRMEYDGELDQKIVKYRQEVQALVAAYSDYQADILNEQLSAMEKTAEQLQQEVRAWRRPSTES